MWQPFYLVIPLQKTYTLQNGYNDRESESVLLCIHMIEYAKIIRIKDRIYYMKEMSLFHLVERELHLVERKLFEMIDSAMPVLGDMHRPLLLAGGKRLRPALYLLCAYQGQQDKERFIMTAAAIELIHMASLVHDDVIDAADIRRNAATANARWGNSAAVLGGDYLFSKAFSLLNSYGTTAAIQILTHSICYMSEGEIAQLISRFNPDQTEADYFIRIEKKTAGLIAAATVLGAMDSGMDETDVERLRQYGYSIGMAFQLADDLMDMTASVQTAGKPVGSDFKQGILTLPAMYALQHSPQQEKLRKIILSRHISGNTLQTGMDIIVQSGGMQYTQQRIDFYLQQACSNIPSCMAPEIRLIFIRICDQIRKS